MAALFCRDGDRRSGMSAALTAAAMCMALLGASASVEAADTIVSFIGAEITYGSYSDPVRTPDINNGVDTTRWNFGDALGDSLWGNGGSRTIWGGCELYGDAARLMRMNADADQIASYVDGNDGTPSPSTNKWHLLWIKDGFLNGGTDRVVEFDSASVLKARVEMSGAANPRHLRWVVRNGSTYYLSEYVDSTSGFGWLSLDDFVGNATAGKRWGAFTPTAADFDIPASLPVFAATTFDDVTAVGFIMEDYRPDYGHNCLVDSVVVTAHAYKTWNGSVSSDWFAAGNWTPSGVPGSDVSVVFDGTATQSCLLTGPVTCGDVLMTGSGVDTDPSNNYAFTCRSLIMSGGAFEANQSTVTVGGDYIITGGTPGFENAGCRIVLSGSGLFGNGDSWSHRARHVTQLNGVSTGLTGSRMRTDSLVTGDASSSFEDSGTGTLEVRQYLVNNGVVWGPGLTLYSSIANFPGADYSPMGLRFDGPTTLAGDVVTSGSVRNHGEAGTSRDINTNGYDLTCYDLYLGASWNSGSNARLVVDSGSVVRVLDDVATEVCTSTVTPTGIVFADNGPCTLFVADDVLLRSGAAVTPGVGVMYLNSGQSHDLTTSGATMSSLTVGAPADTLVLQDGLASAGTVHIDGGLLNFNGFDIDVGGFTVTNGSPNALSGLAGRTITAADVSMSGVDAGTRLGIAPGSAWYVNATSSLGADYADLGNSDASGGVPGIATGNCVNQGGNTNWNFGDAPPTITQQPVAATIDEGQDHTFTVAAIGNPNPSFQWRHDGADISGATGATYTVTSATLADSGNYSVMVYNTVDTVFSQVVKLTVNEVCIPVAITDTLRDTSVTAGADLVLSMTATGSRVHYQWYLGGFAQTDDTLPALTLSSIAASDAGDYFGVAYNACSADTTETATVSVCEVPQVTVQPSNQDVVADNSAIFSVTATGTNRQYQWYRDTAGSWELINNATGSQYSLLAPLSFDSALFRVRVYNGCGEDYSAACTLFVSEACLAPNVSADPHDTTVIERSTATLSVAASGTDLTYQWLRGATQISGATGAVYSFTAQRWNDGVPYRCVVTGGCGVDTSGPAVLSVTDTTRPNPTTSLTLNALGPRDINVKWSTPESDSTDADSVFVYYSDVGYQHYSSGAKLVAAAQPTDTADGEQSLDVSNLEPGKRYYFSVWLRDTVGNWAAADSDTVSTIQEGVPTNPVVVRGQYVDDTHVQLTLSNFCQLPSGNDPFGLWARYVGVWYEAGAFALAADTTQTSLLLLPLAAIQTAAGCPNATFDTLVSLPALTGSDSLYFFSASVMWHNPDSIMPFTQSNGDSVLMRDVSPPTNALTIAGAYPGGRSDSATVSLGNTGSLEPKVADIMVVCSFDSAFADTISVRNLEPATVSAADPYAFVIRNTAFDGARQTVYCAVVLTSDQGVKSAAVTSSFEVGRDIPPNPISLVALPLSSFEIGLSWPSVAGTGADSIRIFRDTMEIPLNVVDAATPFSTVYLAGTAVADTVGGLNASTVYHFAAQAHIGGEWTAVSPASRSYAATFDANPGDTIPNTVVIDRAWFDTATNRICVAWTYSLADSVSYGVTFGLDSAAAAATTPAEWDSALSATDTSYIPFGEDIRFDTTYYVFIRLRKAGGLPSGVSEAATAAVRLPAYTWEPIVYFTSPTGDTARAFNNSVTLWYNGTWGFGLFRDTVRAFVPDSLPAGLKPVSAGFSLSRYDDGPTLTVALRYDSVPSGYSPDDIRMYRYTSTGQWVVYHDYTLHGNQGRISVDTRLLSMVNEPLILMVDQQRPTAVALNDIDSPVAAGVALLDSVHVSDNIANLAVTVLYSRAEDAPRPMLFDTLQATSGTFEVEVASGYVTDDAGVRVYLVVSDGLYSDTLNLSRQVVRAEASDLSTEASSWVPLRTTAVLDDPSMGTVLSTLLGGGYDNTVCRVFRWFDPVSDDGVSRGTHDWVEYNDPQERLFRIVPGRLMWIKTKESRRPRFGSGVTTSLRDNQRIELPPQNWTDIALPYNFGICLGDILDATGAMADSLQYYRWANAGDGVYTTQTMYIATLTDSLLKDPATVLNAGARDGFSVYNPTESPVDLVIPPVTYAMSSYRVVGRGLPKSAAQGKTWSLRLEPRVGESRALGPVVLGYAPAQAGQDKTWYPSAPSFSDAGVCVVDATGGRFGHAVAHRTVDGGVSFRVEFFNNADTPRRITCAILGSESIPDSLSLAVVEPRTGAVDVGPEAIVVDVPAKGRAVRIVSVGDPSHHAHALAGVKAFAGFMAYPNPFRGAVALQFMLPENVSRVEYRLFDAQGRQLWHQVQRTGLQTGANRVVWDGTVGAGTAAATGTYLLQATAYDTDGKVLGTREQRMVRVR